MTQPTKTQITAARLTWVITNSLEVMPKEIDEYEESPLGFWTCSKQGTQMHPDGESFAEIFAWVPTFEFTGNDADAMKLLDGIAMQANSVMKCYGRFSHYCEIFAGLNIQKSGEQKTRAHAISIAYAAYAGLGSYEIVPGGGEVGCPKILTP